ITSLYETEDFEDAAQQAAKDTELAALTRSEKGSVIIADGQRLEIPVHPVDRLVDSTGAGDLYAAGFLFALATGKDFATAGKFGSVAAAEIISHIGARPEVRLSDLVQGSAQPA